MMRSKKSKVIQRYSKDTNMVDLFNHMLGIGEPDPNIVIPKYEEIVKILEHLLKVLDGFAISPCGRLLINELCEGIPEISEFTTKSRLELRNYILELNDKVYTVEELREINNNPELIGEFISKADSKYKLTGLGQKYRGLKKSKLIGDLILTARNIKKILIEEKDRTGSETHDLQVKSDLRPGFISNFEGDYLDLFSFSKLNFKQIYYISENRNDPTMMKYILLIMHIFYTKSLEIINLITSPDGDIKKISKAIIEIIQGMKKQLPRCTNAFSRIENSLELLESRFPEYYKDFVSSQNPGIFIENFVFDVSKSTESSPSLAREFTEIVSYFQSRFQKKESQDPRLSDLFQQLTDNLKILQENKSPE